MHDVEKPLARSLRPSQPAKQRATTLCVTLFLNLPPPVHWPGVFGPLRTPASAPRYCTPPPALQEAKELAGEAADSAKHAAHNVADATRHGAEATRDAAGNAAHWGKEKAGVSAQRTCRKASLRRPWHWQGCGSTGVVCWQTACAPQPAVKLPFLLPVEAGGGRRRTPRRGLRRR